MVKESSVSNVIIVIKLSPQEYHLNKHIESVHEGKKQFQYNVCNTSFSRTGHLNGDIVSVHEGKKPFKFNDCDASRRTSDCAH